MKIGGWREVIKRSYESSTLTLMCQIIDSVSVMKHAVTSGVCRDVGVTPHEGSGAIVSPDASQVARGRPGSNSFPGGASTGETSPILTPKGFKSLGYTKSVKILTLQQYGIVASGEEW